MASAKTLSRTTWALAALLAATFLLSGSGKLLDAKSSNGIAFHEQFVVWGYPAWFRLVVGGLEVAGAIGLLIPALRFAASSGLTLLMVGATMTHLRTAGEAMAAPIPLVLALLTVTVAYLNRPARMRNPSANASNTGGTMTSRGASPDTSDDSRDGTRGEAA